MEEGVIVDPLCVASVILISIDQILWTTSVLVTLFISRSGGTSQRRWKKLGDTAGISVLFFWAVLNFLAVYVQRN